MVITEHKTNEPRGAKAKSDIRLLLQETEGKEASKDAPVA